MVCPWADFHKYHRLNSIILRFLKPTLIQIGHQIWRSLMKMCENMTFTAPIFTKFCLSVEFWGPLLYRIVCESDEKCRKYGKQSAAPMPSKLAFAQWHNVGIVCVEFNPERSVSTEITSIHSFMPLRQMWLSQCRFARKSCLLKPLLRRRIAVKIGKPFGC